MARYGGALRKRVGLAIQARRRVLGLSQDEIARRARLSNPYVSQIETGKRNPSLVTLDCIATALEMKLFELLKE
jgi:transcriptional regulator with XRE-family HTH domain